MVEDEVPDRPQCCRRVVEDLAENPCLLDLAGGVGLARITLPDVEAAVHSCFSTVFAASVIRVAYGPGFARPVPVEDDAFIDDLAQTALRYLLSA
ncbi:hypothetical protein PV367_02400 [Streptomyces europaeiscabiei]|uniref:Uncharacterized protein n=1 Tax=Streptomyces europaeiscabiei TaxID=146819 RepID=A0AAJ2PJT8_9ACTN|nr:hypothetical protein [Streptomyces europaeiscabiei]MDX3128674.1 hypothetical protein [Streptomyces europaeiscabiei]